MPAGHAQATTIASMPTTDTAAFPGPLTVAGTLGVTGAATLASTLAVTGATTLTGVATLAALAVLTTGFSQAAVARTATSDGLTTGIIADAGCIQFITVTSANADHIIVLPTPTPGTLVILCNGTTGYELRSSAPSTVLINGGAGGAAVESAIAASTMVIAYCKSATAWAAIGLAGTTLAAVEAAA